MNDNKREKVAVRPQQIGGQKSPRDQQQQVASVQKQASHQYQQIKAYLQELSCCPLS